MNINLEKLYKGIGTNLSHATIEKGDGYYDLLDEFGEIVAMDGDEVEVVKQWDEETDTAVLRNTFDGLRFELNLMEIATAFC